eukprot:CAMPEP_0196662484 /NCGR_PEP_ID=MMETSP1086-20130531/48918_1 /TAXON_ID=77921 /ORGANISM="Cyanoptyche  gloeocystis , Strain SAG4.97" /LENGTH=151 /DNA_ID=CAMNT_0041997891 /DNA_START=41 /DNA_END=496 /DNA_ORIENTATION=+
MAFCVSQVSVKASLSQCFVLNVTKASCSTEPLSNQNAHEELLLARRSFFGAVQRTKPCMAQSFAFRPSSSLDTLSVVAEAAFEVGQRVRVSESVIVYHHPDRRNEPFDVKGLEGSVVKVVGGLISANLPIQVEFEKKFKAHFREEELEKVE